METESDNSSFAIFILTHGRPKSVHTLAALKKAGYTGKVVLVLDNEDKSEPEYRSIHPLEHIVVFDKEEISKTFDSFDNFKEKRAIIYARNASFNIAKELGIKYFMQMDDDYTGFYYKLYLSGKAINAQVKNMDKVLSLMLDYYKSIPAKSIAFAQGGDFIGGIDNGKELFRFSKRKAMNSFLCSTERPFNFIGKINEDVNTYTSYQSKGNLFLTIKNIALIQKQTQKTKGGMTDIYVNNGTYIKSFYSVICSPNCVSIKLMSSAHKRLHHSIDWNSAVPLIIDERYKKQ